MADTIDLTPLLLEIRETNRLTQSLRDLAIKDDTPAERVKDQLPEILAEKRFIDKQMNQAEDLNTKEPDLFCLIVLKSALTPTVIRPFLLKVFVLKGASPSNVNLLPSEISLEVTLTP